jgi:hypothetical protein
VADVGAWTAAATACAAAIGTVIAAARQPADVAALRAETKAAREALPADIKTAVDAVRAAFEMSIGDVRGNLASVAKRVGVLEDWRKTSHAQTIAGRATVVSSPDVGAMRDAEHERRITALEAKMDRMDTALNEARISLGNVLGQLAAFGPGRNK